MKIFVDENLTVDEALLLEPELRPEFVEKMGAGERTDSANYGFQKIW